MEPDPLITSLHPFLCDPIYYSETKTTRYWGGIPVGTRGGSDLESDSRYAGTLDSEVFLFNHFNLKIAYRKDKQDKYQILRFWVEAFSIRHDESDTNTLTSCVAGSTTHTNYDQLFGTPLQPATGIVKYTYDVQWIESDATSYNDRWDIYLSMDDATPDVIELLGVFLGVFLLVCLVGALYTWVMRDLSYKPIVGQADFTEEEASEVQMWPLSTQVFFPPVSSPVLLCIACGTGAQLLLSGFSFVFLFRCGVISQSQGANLLTPGAILYVLSSPVGGYVTARLYAIFHGDVVIALVSCLATAISYPLLGTLVLFLVYDVLPDGDETPSYNVMSNSTPLILLWIFLMWPLSIAGGYSGYRHGPVQNFPISTGTSGYHDLNLQDNSESRAAEQEQKRSSKFTRCTTRYRILILFLTCGLLPVLSCFINYSYGVAAPILIRSYSLRAYMVASFCLFVLVAAAVSVLMFYRQIRVHNYQWWWSSFASAGSSGVYIFFLSMSWLLLKAESHISSNTMALYSLWFAFLSLGVALMTGFAGVAACIWFNRAMYTTIMRRQ